MSKNKTDLSSLFKNLDKTRYIPDVKDKQPNKGGDKVISEEKTLKKYHNYQIPLSELMYKIRKENTGNNPDSPMKISTDLIRVKNSGSIDIEYIKDIKVKYLACKVNKEYEFSKLEKRRIPIEDAGKDKIYYIPLNFLKSLLPSDFSRSDSIESELADISIFKYTGDIEILYNTSIFSLSDYIYLARKEGDESRNIEVLI